MNNTYLDNMEKHIKNRKSFSLNEKLKIIEAIESGKSQSAMCKTLNLNKSTVSNIWGNRSKIKDEWHKNAKKKNCVVRHVQKWIQCYSHGFSSREQIRFQ